MKITSGEKFENVRFSIYQRSCCSAITNVIRLSTRGLGSSYRLFSIIFPCDVCAAVRCVCTRDILYPISFLVNNGGSVQLTNSPLFRFPVFLCVGEDSY